jgi:hypothetical protein
MKLLKKPEIFSLGVLDSVYSCSIQLYIFFWTPVLQETAQTKNINAGMYFFITMLNILSQNKILELLNKTLKPNYFYLNFIYLIIHATNFYIVYKIDDFAFRIIFLSCINVKY